jgi:hypothetical protein
VQQKSESEKKKQRQKQEQEQEQEQLAAAAAATAATAAAAAAATMAGRGSRAAVDIPGCILPSSIRSTLTCRNQLQLVLGTTGVGALLLVVVMVSMMRRFGANQQAVRQEGEGNGNRRGGPKRAGASYQRVNDPSEEYGQDDDLQSLYQTHQSTRLGWGGMTTSASARGGGFDDI